MTFGARTLGYLSAELTPTFIVSASGGSNLGPKSVTTYQNGWCPYTFAGPGPTGIFYPSTPIGSLVSGNPGIGVLVITAAWSYGSASGSADVYAIAVQGSVSSGITNLSVAGTNIGGTAVYTGDGANGITRITWTRTTAATLFSGSNVTVVVS